MTLSKRGSRKALAGISEFHKIYFILCNQEPITRSEQVLYACVTAFSLASLFLERFERKLKISLRSHKPVIKTKTPKVAFLTFSSRLVFLCHFLYL